MPREAANSGLRRAAAIALILSGLVAFAALARPIVLWCSDDLLTHRDALKAFVDVAPVPGAALFVCAFVLATSIALPVGGLLALLAGFLFGEAMGAGLVVASGTLAAIVVYAVARAALSDAARARMGPRIRNAVAAIERRGFWCLLSLRLVPLVPAFALNVAAGTIAMRPRSFVAATALGKCPGAFIYAVLGAGLGSATSIRDLVRPQIGIALTGLAVMAVLPVVVSWLRHRRARATLPA